MGFLLLQYEYQRANSKVSYHQRAGMTLNNQLDRLTKRISKMEKLFEKQQSNIETKWNQFENQASAALNSIQTSAGYAADANSAYVAVRSQLAGIRIGGVTLDQFVDCSQILYAGQYNNGQNGQNGQSAILSAVGSVLAQAKAVMGELINEIKTQQSELLDAQQNEQMAPLSEKEIDLQANINLNDTLSEQWKTRAENAKSHLGEGVKDSMAGFGLK